MKPWQVYGDLRVTADGHRLEHADGTPFFWLGDTAWRLPTISPEDADRYFEVRSAHGFNVVLFNLTGMNSPDFVGNRPFEGDGPTWQEFSPKEAYWSEIDRIFDQAESQGMYLLGLPWWGPQAGDPERKFFADPDTANFQYGKFLGERYGSRPNLIWCVAGEYSKPYVAQTPSEAPEEHIRHLELVAEGILSAKSPKRLMTIHPAGLLSSSDDFHDREWLDFNMVQTHKGFDYIVPMVSADYALNPPKPVLSSEGWYEDEPKMYELPTWDDIDPAWLQRFQAYWSVFHGSFGFAYGHRKVWRMESDEGERGCLPVGALESEAATSLRHLRTLVETEFPREWKPAQELLTTGTRGSDFGRFYGTSPNLNCSIMSADRTIALVYSTRGTAFCVRTDQLAAGTMDAFWFDPRSGSRKELEHGELSGGLSAKSRSSRVWFYPPGQPEDANDWVLKLSIRSPRDSKSG